MESNIYVINKYSLLAKWHLASTIRQQQVSEEEFLIIIREAVSRFHGFDIMNPKHGTAIENHCKTVLIIFSNNEILPYCRTTI